jgi:hypothetical protein
LKKNSKIENKAAQYWVGFQRKAMARWLGPGCQHGAHDARGHAVTVTVAWRWRSCCGHADDSLTVRSSLRAQGGSRVAPGKVVGGEGHQSGLSTVAGGDEAARLGSSMTKAIR